MLSKDDMKLSSGLIPGSLFVSSLTGISFLFPKIKSRHAQLKTINPNNISEGYFSIEIRDHKNTLGNGSTFR
jgi:hypothetical protein